MDAFVIEGGARLRGTIEIGGSKNASLPLMAACLLTDDSIRLDDVPRLRDIQAMRTLLGELGCQIEDPASTATPWPASSPGEAIGGTLLLRVADQSQSHARYEIVRTMRASICVLGPLLAKRGSARISMPGGCAIGDRPIDLHLRGLRALGAEIHLEEGDIIATAETLRGATVFLGGPFGSTVLGTANVMSAATLAAGVTVIESAACEPEIVDLADLLIAMGAHIRGAGTPRIIIEGVAALGSARHRVMPDRIEAGTYALAGAITNGDLTLTNFPRDCLLALEDRLSQIGIHIRPIGGSGGSDGNAANGLHKRRCSVVIESKQRLDPIQVTTQPHPGYPTDLQAQLMAVLCLADGISVVTERIFPERFLHVAELGRMGANLTRQGSTVVVSGVGRLIGAPVMASDLRASAGLVLAGLAAEGRTVVNRVYHLDRGYESMEKKLAAVGARITRVDAADVPEPALALA